MKVEWTLKFDVDSTLNSDVISTLIQYFLTFMQCLSLVEIG